MDTILLSSKPIEISEYKTYKEAIFLISVLDEWDLNNRLIPKDVGEKYHKTIIGFPIVAKLIRDKDGNPVDFRGHEMKIIQDENGNTEYSFGTQPIGSVLDSWIEQREVEGYEGLKDCIMIKCKLWSDRYPEYFEVLDKLWAENNIKSSWELTVEKCEKTIRGKIIKVFSFLGNALLGSTIDGAVPGAGVYEYAENSNDNFDTSELVLASALSSDCNKISDIKTEEQEENISVSKVKNEVAEGEVKDAQVETPVANITETSEDKKEKKDATTEGNPDSKEVSDKKEKETSSLTMYDLREILNKAIQNVIRYGWVSYVFPAENYCLVKDDSSDMELDYLKFTYTVENDEVTLGEPEKVTFTISVAEINNEIATKNEALVKANEEIQTLKAENETLISYRERCEKEDVEKAEIELTDKQNALKNYALKSGKITEAELEEEKFKTIISELKDLELKAIISDRVVASLLPKENKVETSEVNKEKPKANLETSEDNNIDAISIVKSFLKK